MSDWSLYQKNQGREGEKDDFLKPLTFSNQKTQEDIVNEVLDAINQGNKIIFIKGVCGSGKSAIALNIAKKIGKTSIVVPIKNLQNQYEEDYSDKKYVLKPNGEKLKIKVITGRANHLCPFFKENQEFFSNKSNQIIKKEQNANLESFTNNQRTENIKEEENLNNTEQDPTCDNNFLPCKIEIKNKNQNFIRNYLKKNPKVKSSFIQDIEKTSRFLIAPLCEYWSPILPQHINIKHIDDSKPEEYNGLKDIKYKFCKRKKGCPYYEQYNSYINSDVIVFNSRKYLIETEMNRKPATDIEIIDECDEFLDSFTEYERINLNKLAFSLLSLFSEKEEIYFLIESLRKEVEEIIKNNVTKELINSQKIIKLKDTKISKILKSFLEHKIMDYVECDEENYCYHCEKVAKVFEDLEEESFVNFSKKDSNIFCNIVTINLKKRTEEIISKNKVFVMMSGTLHSESVLKSIFGIENFKIINAEEKMPGKVSIQKTGKERNCTYKNLQTGIIPRKDYLLALQESVLQSKKPLLIHVNSFKDLPSEEEIEIYDLDANVLIAREELRNTQKEDKKGKNIIEFKNKKKEILYTTRCNRGIDFPGDICNSVLLTKYPYPNVSSLFWTILKKTKPNEYNMFYIDKARREFLQKIYRAVRSEKDHVFVLSPDKRVFDNLNKLRQE